ncbi:UNVERIFIED_CONTAM: hypothetical protein NCL1_39307 [Trichonephila clavipes]
MQSVEVSFSFPKLNTGRKGWYTKNHSFVLYHAVRKYGVSIHFVERVEGVVQKNHTFVLSHAVCQYNVSKNVDEVSYFFHKLNTYL